MGAAFLAILKQSKRLKLAIPEVLDQELDKHRAETAQTLLRQLEEVVAEVGTVTGDSLAGGIVTLTEEAIDVAIRQRLAGVAEQTIHPKLALEQVRRTLDRVNAGTPPNGHKNQQMKDSLLWEACIELTEDYKVFLVTSDTGFYADRQLKNGVAKNLAAEPSVRSGRLLVLPSLGEALSSLAPDSLVDSDETPGVDVRDLIAAESRYAFKRSPVAADLRSNLTERGVVAHYFRTEVPYIFAVSFSAFFYVNDDGEKGARGQVAVSGECTFDTRQATVGAVSLNAVDWRIRDATGAEVKIHEELASMS